MLPPDFAISSIHIRIYSDWISLFLAGDCKEISVDFENRENGCCISWWEGREKHMKILEGQDFLFVALNYIQKILENQVSILEDFAGVMLYKHDEERDLNPSAVHIFQQIERILKNRKGPLKTEHLVITAIDEDQVMQILPLIDSNSLRRLTINNAREPNQQKSEEKLDYGKIVRTEQFKNVKELAIMGFVIDSNVGNLLGFRSLQVAFEKINFELFQELRQKLVVSTFEYIQLRFLKLEFDLEENLEKLYGLPSGEMDQLGHKRRQWFLKTTDPEKVESVIVFYDNILLSQIERKYILKNDKIV